MAESSILTADCRSSTNVLCKNFKLGEPVLFCDCWGDICNTDKLYYWGELRAGFITGIEPIGQNFIYIVSTTDERDKTKIKTKLLGKRFIFKMTDKLFATETLQKVCLKPW